MLYLILSITLITLGAVIYLVGEGKLEKWLLKSLALIPFLIGVGIIILFIVKKIICCFF